MNRNFLLIAVFVLAVGAVFLVGSPASAEAAPELGLLFQSPLPPANDNFANATGIPGLPFSDAVDTSTATFEPGEPTPSCAYGYPADKTVWYVFTPAVSGSVSSSISTSYWAITAAYTGNSLNALSQVACWEPAWLTSGMTFYAQAGMSYYIQVVALSGEGGSLHFSLDVTPPPQADFSFSPWDPSVFDPISFWDFSNDPGGIGFASYAWDFGDGTTATECCPTHQYAADGDYLVQETVTTHDGRTGSTSQQVSVRTHDVAIAKFSAPGAAKVGQTRQLRAGVSSKLYDETVQVDLYKSVPSGYELVGSLTQFVPTRSGNRTTDFHFSYTFTGADAALGKVTFKAVATVTTGRDAWPADNEAIASPTKVNP